MSIGKKIALGVSVNMGIVLVIGALSFWSTLQYLDTSSAVTHTHEVLEDLESLLSLLKDVETGQRGYLLTGKSGSLKPYREAVPLVTKKRDHLREWIKDNAKQVERLETSLDPLIQTRLRDTKELVGDERDSENPAVDFAPAIVKVRAFQDKLVMDKIRDVIKDMENTEKDILKDREAKARWSAWVTMITTGVGTLALILLVSVGGYFLVHSITAPVRQLMDGTSQIGKGVLSHRVAVATHDEIGELARAFNHMAEVRQHAHEAMREAASQLSSASAEILAGTTQQASGAQEQAAAVTQTMATVDEVTQTADQAAQRAKSVGDSVQRTLEFGKSGRKVVEDSLVAMDVVKEKVETTAENILMLAEQAQAIGDIIATVNDIAEQTNLLALNAAIEASRAGEHGKGFTVVAGEVKALADQSKKATMQVRQILGEIQKATNTAVLSTEEVTKGVAAAIQVGGQAGETIKTLTDTLNETTRVVTQIAASIGQQATGMTQINQAMKNIDQVAKQNTVATRQAAQAAENLNTLGTRLTALTAE